MIEEIYIGDTLLVSVNNFKKYMEDLCKPCRRVRQKIHNFRNKLSARGMRAVSFTHQWDGAQSLLDNGRGLAENLRKHDRTVDTVILTGVDSRRSVAACAAALLADGHNVVVVEDLIADSRAETRKPKSADWHADKLRNRVTRAVFAAGHAGVTKRLDVMTRQELVRMIADEAHRPPESDVTRSNADFVII